MNLFKKPLIGLFIILIIFFIVALASAQEKIVSTERKSSPAEESSPRENVESEALPKTQPKQPSFAKTTIQKSKSSQASNTRSWFLVPPPQDSYLPMMVRPGYWGGAKRNIGFADFFIPMLGKNETFLFFNPHLSWDDHHDHEYNLGLGIRSLRFDEKVILGINTYFDNKDVKGAGYFKQAGLGLEALSDFMDARLNYYWALSDKKEVESSSTYSFASHSLLEYTTPGYIEPMSGLDYEAGILVPGISNFMETRFYVGGYNYFAKVGKNVNGFSTRLDIMPSPLLNIDIQFKNDSVNGAEVYGGFYVSLPFEMGNIAQGKNPFDGWKDLFKFGQGTRPLKDRMTDMVIRDIDVIAEEVTGPTTQSTEVDGMVYVDNSNTGTEDGSYEHPYNTIQEGVDNAFGDKWVYVREGSSSYVEQVELASGITLWGSGYNGGFNGITAPGYPVVDGDSLYHPIFVDGENDITVMGVHAQDAIMGVIFIREADNVTVKHCIVNDNHQQAGAITVFASNYTTTSNIYIQDNIIYDNASGAIYIATELARNPIFENIFVERNTIYGTNPVGIGFYNRTATVSNVTIANNNISDATIGGIVFTNTSSKAEVAKGVENVTIANNTITGITQDGIAFTFYYGDLDGLNISGNSVYDNGRSGIQLVASSGITMDNVVISSNTVTGNLDGLVLAAYDSGSTVSVSAYRNIIANNSQYGVVTDLGSVYGSIVADLGGGSLDSVGYNSIYDNLGYDVNSDLTQTVSIKAENNWWGQSTGPGSGSISGDVDYTPWLTSDPN